MPALASAASLDSHPPSSGRQTDWHRVTHLLQLSAVRSVNTSFVLRTKKFTTRLPVG